VSLVAAVVLLVTFGFIEVRSKHALVPIRVLRSRDRTGAYLISLCVGTAMFGMFFFLTVFVQTVWGFSPVKSGLSYLPMVAAIMAASGIASQLVSRIGARPLMVGGAATMAGGLFWLSQLTEHSTYTGGLLGPMMVAGFGLGLVFVPLSLVALARVGNNDAGAASALVNTGQQVGGSIGLALLGTVAWSAVASSLRSASASAAGHASAHLTPAAAKAAQAAVSNHALAYGFSRGYVVSAGIALLALLIAVVMIRIKREALAGINPMAAPAD
jgi:predicted MFS family arabinose efflux permease